MAQTLPKLVSKLCYGHDAWLVGSAVRDENPKDYDVAVPFCHWKKAAMLIPSDAKPNSFGGWKCVYDGHKIDIWPCEIGGLMTHRLCTHLCHPKSGTVFVRQ